MTEQQIQDKRIKQLEGEGYFVIKLLVTNKNGIPDLIAIPPDSNVLFSEIKKLTIKCYLVKNKTFQKSPLHNGN